MKKWQDVVDEETQISGSMSLSLGRPGRLVFCG